MNTHKEVLGKKMFDRYDEVVASGARTAFSIVAEETAADALLKSPYVTHPLIESGVIKGNENQRLSNLWKANLYGQYHAHGEGKLHIYNVDNAHNRAKVVLEHVFNTSPKFREMLRVNGKTIQDAYTALKQSMLVESLQCAYISGQEISTVAKVAAESALIKRFVSESKRFREIVRGMGFNPADLKEVRDASKFFGDFRTPIIKAWDDVPYFQKRREHFGVSSEQTISAFDLFDDEVPEFKRIDKGDNVIEMKRHTRRGFSEEFFADLARAAGLDVEKIVTELHKGGTPRMY